MTMTFTFQRAPLAISFEVGSLEEGIAALQEQETALRTIVGLADSLNMPNMPTATQASATEPPKQAEEPKKRGRPAKNQPDPATASAPEPIKVGDTPPAPEAPKPIDATPNANGVPAFLDRNKQEAAPPPPAPIAPPPAPPVAPPPSGILAGKIIADLDKRATDDANKKALAEWIGAHGLVSKTASYDDAIAAIRLIADDKLGQLAQGLGIS